MARTIDYESAMNLDHAANLRIRLRTATRHAHDRVDNAFSHHDLADAAGLTEFLSAHYGALTTAMPKLAESGFNFDQLPDLIVRDLATLGTAPVSQPTPSDTPLRGHGLGYAYVVTGSHLGAQVLNRQRLNSGDPTVLEAGAYLAGSIGKHTWRSLTAQLEIMDADGPHPNDIVTGALTCFEIFEHAASATAHGGS